MICKDICTKTNFLIARGYERIVSGARGDYIEMTKDQIILSRLVVPLDKEWRITDPDVYYIEFRTKDESYTKVYFQKNTVKYADYKIGYYYISVEDVIME